MRVPTVNGLPGMSPPELSVPKSGAYAESDFVTLVKSKASHRIRGYEKKDKEIERNNTIIAREKMEGIAKPGQS